MHLRSSAALWFWLLHLIQTPKLVFQVVVILAMVLVVILVMIQLNLLGPIAESPLAGSRSTTVCAINEPHFSGGVGGTSVTAEASTLNSVTLSRFGFPTQQHSLHRNGSSASGMLLLEVPC